MQPFCSVGAGAPAAHLHQNGNAPEGTQHTAGAASTHAHVSPILAGEANGHNGSRGVGVNIQRARTCDCAFGRLTYKILSLSLSLSLFLSHTHTHARANKYAPAIPSHNTPHRVSRSWPDRIVLSCGAVSQLGAACRIWHLRPGRRGRGPSDLPDAPAAVAERYRPMRQPGLLAYPVVAAASSRDTFTPVQDMARFVDQLSRY